LLIGGETTTQIKGGAGFDVVSFLSIELDISINIGLEINVSATGTTTVTGSLAGGGQLNNQMEGVEGFTGSTGDDNITGSENGDALNGGAGNDNIDGGEGDDTLTCGEGNDTLTGGDGIDIVSYVEASVGVEINLETGITVVGQFENQISGFEGAIGSEFNDVITGGAVAGLNLQAGGGSDTYKLTAANAVGTTIKDGGGTDDVIEVEGVTLSLPPEGEDAAPATGTKVLRDGTNLVVDLDNDGQVDATKDLVVEDFFSLESNAGGAGVVEQVANLTSAEILAAFPNPEPPASGSGSGSGTVTDPVAPPSSSSTTTTTGTDVSVEFTTEFNVSVGNDVVIGTAAANLIFGLAGNDQIDAGAGDDTVNGNQGEDVVNGGDGNDTCYGGQGNDSVSGGDGNDMGSGDRGDDIVNGDAGQDQLTGGQDNDSIDGGADNDNIFGGQGNDLINGGDGDDVISGDAGTDTLIGGAGNDVFVLRTGTAAATAAEADLILDYREGDTIGLTGGITPDNLTFTVENGNTIIEVNNNGVTSVLGIVSGVAPEQLTFSTADIQVNFTGNVSVMSSVFVGGTLGGQEFAVGATAFASVDFSQSFALV